MEGKVNEVIILAGDYCSPSSSESVDVPKVFIPVNGQPFLYFLLHNLSKKGIKRVILAVGCGNEAIIEKIGDHFEGMEIVYSLEQEPMGTGGALKLALEKAVSKVLFVLNGDTYFDIDLSDLADFHQKTGSVCTLALKEMHRVDRYNGVETNAEGKVSAFREKKFFDTVNINGGIYCINKGILIHYPVNTPFSFEVNYLENNPRAKKIYGLVFENYFMNIGVPADYQQFALDMRHESE